MTLYPCQKCPNARFHNIYAYHLHRASDHGEYEDGQDVAMKTESQLEKVGQRVLWLLIHEPATRNNKNWMLWTRYQQRYSRSHILVYDEANQGWMVNRPGGVLKDDDLRELFAELETARRRRQDYQRADRETYHDPKGALFGRLHICVLPKEKDMILAELKQREMRAHYSGQARMFND